MTAASVCAAQSWSAVRLDVLNELNALKPKNTEQYVYRVRVPARPRVLPANIRVDLVYKYGHYDFEYTAVRFERRDGEPLVNVSYFSYGSALAFWRKYSETKQDTYWAKAATMPVDEFDTFLLRSVAYYDSDIEEIYIPPKPVKKNGRWSGGTFSTTRSFSSGDGSIMLGISHGDKSIINDDGRLYGGNLKSRMDNGYEEMRPNLVWKLFHDRLKSSDFLHPVPPSEIESLAIARLNEPALSDIYLDYFRQSLFIEILGEFGTANSLDTLKRVSFNSGLEPDWHEGIQRRISDVVKKISSRQ